jgi:hypothetical protein
MKFVRFLSKAQPVYGILYSPHQKASSYQKNFRENLCLKFISLIVLLAFINLIVGCSYYKVNTIQSTSGKEIIELENKNRVIIVHLTDKAWIFRDIKIENNQMHGSISGVQGHEMYKTTDPNGVNRYKDSQADVLNEVHIYITATEKLDNYEITFNIDQIAKIELYDKAVGATTASYVFTTLGVVGLTVATILIIILLTKSSCPFVYISDGESYKFSGEIYSGAVQPPLERHDYLSLQGLKAQNGEYKIKISNEIHEIQNTNLAKLVVFDHPAGSKVLIDKNGVYQTATDLKTPSEAFNLAGKDVLKTIANNDDTLSYYGDDTNIETDGVIMKFDRPQAAKSGKLFIRAKNSFWLDYVFSQFNNSFGSAYKSWVEKQEKGDVKEMRQWSLNQKIPLSVYVEKNGNWEFVDYYNLSGPMAFKEDVMAINIPDTGSEPLKIKLESGSFFWDIDYAAMDFTPNLDLVKHEIEVGKAINEKQEDVTDLLKADDDKYYIQPEIGNAAFLSFYEPPKKDNLIRSEFLHSKGFYEILSNPSGVPDRKFLEAFREPGRFTKFSNEIMQHYLKTKGK